jgi:rubrerythrin
VLLTPAVGAVLMAASTVIVAINACRLRLKNGHDVEKPEEKVSTKTEQPKTPDQKPVKSVTTFIKKTTKDKAMNKMTLMLMLLLVGAALAALTGCKTVATAAASSPAMKYTCPMHPEIVRAAPGNCPICGMALVRKP